MKRREGKPLPVGVTVGKDAVNFSIAVPEKKTCQLLLYKAGEVTPTHTFELKEEDAFGEMCFIALEGLETEKYEYNYEIDGEVVLDPYVKEIAGKSIWGEKKDLSGHEIRGKLTESEYDWEGDRRLQIPVNEVIAYALHVRGFTKHSSSQVRGKGTFKGLMGKIPYLKELGINQIQCMPVYEFEEVLEEHINYWGYGPAYYFAPKAAYASGKSAVKEFKDMVKACHSAGIEVVLDMAFEEDVPLQMMDECLRYYMLEYHIDGFILNPGRVPIAMFRKDPLLKAVKILENQDGFSNCMRRFLKGDEGCIGDVMWHSRHLNSKMGIYNYLTSHNGFTLNDLVSYDHKHNEDNGEENQDGSDYNFSWNCGVEGPSRKKEVVKLRKKQIKNAFTMLLLSQGTPCILAGDEFANSQKGNNNAYCQDNAISWLNWKNLEKEKELFAFVKELIAFRKQYGILHPKMEAKGMDQTSCGFPDISYHGESAWRVPDEYSSRELGIYYCGQEVKEYIFVAYNMHWIEHEFALPTLPKGRKWHLCMQTSEVELPKDTQNSKRIAIEGRSIAILIGK